MTDKHNINDDISKPAMIDQMKSLYTGDEKSILNKLKFHFLPVFTIFFLILVPDMVQAQNGGFAGAYSRMGFGPRGMGMGNAMSSVTAEGIFAHYNPALAAAKVDGIQLDLSTAAMSFDRTLSTANAAFALPPKAGLSVSLINANVSNIDGRSQSGYHTDNFSTHQYQFSTAFGLRASSRVYLGVGVKLNVADLHQEVPTATTVGIDFGALVRATDHLNVSFTVQDLLASYQWDSSNLYNLQGSRNLTNDFPTRFIWGASYKLNDQWIISSEYEVRSQSSKITTQSVNADTGEPTVVSSTKDIRTNSQQFRLGTAYTVHPRITLRAGWQTEDVNQFKDSGHLSAGFSIHLPFDKLSPSVDYAFVREPGGFSNMHVFSILLHI